MKIIRIILAALIVIPVVFAVVFGCIAMWAWIAVTDPLYQKADSAPLATK
jgi:hypothetical protein